MTIKKNNSKSSTNSSKNKTTKSVEKATRDGFGSGLLEAGKKNKNVVVLAADLLSSCRGDAFAAKFPERTIEVGVAEQNLAGVAAGMALTGKKAFALSFAAFNPGRNWDQVRVSICYSNASVVLVGSHAGVTVGEDGATHQALEDIALMRVLPNMTVIVPCDFHQAHKATVALAKYKKPAYLRLSREKFEAVTTEKTPFTIGKAQVLRDGNDITIIACGNLVRMALLAAQELAQEHIGVEVINMHTIKPLDKKTILRSAQKTNAVICCEEHQIHGGLGSAVAELLAKEHPCKMKFIGMQDQFGTSGKGKELLSHFGMDQHAIKEKIIEMMIEKKHKERTTHHKV